MRASKTPAKTMSLQIVGIGHGDYLCSDRNLYCVEHLRPQRALLEDCLTGTRLDVSISELAQLRPVKTATQDS